MCDCKCNCQNFKPKEESAFKKWFLSYAGYEFDELDLLDARFSVGLAFKHAWDGAIEEALKLVHGRTSYYKQQRNGEFEPAEYILKDDIEKLKEK